MNPTFGDKATPRTQPGGTCHPAREPAVERMSAGVRFNQGVIGMAHALDVNDRMACAAPGSPKAPMNDVIRKPRPRDDGL